MFYRLVLCCSQTWYCVDKHISWDYSVLNIIRQLYGQSLRRRCNQFRTILGNMTLMSSGRRNKVCGGSRHVAFLSLSWICKDVFRSPWIHSSCGLKWNIASIECSSTGCVCWEVTSVKVLYKVPTVKSNYLFKKKSIHAHTPRGCESQLHVCTSHTCTCDSS